MNYKNARIYTSGCRFVTGSFSVENGVFSNVLGAEAADAEDLGGATVIPGMIDLHTHGIAGHDFSDGDFAVLSAMAESYAKAGTTSFAATSLTLPPEAVGRAFRSAGRLVGEAPENCAALRGINMEGPFFSYGKRGGQNPDYLLAPDFELLLRLNEASGGLVKIADVAPELPGAMDFIRHAAERFTVSIAHTEADYGTAKAAIGAGARQLTHLFNAMNPLHHRQPGPIAAAAEDPRVRVELIGDGLHVHPAMIRLAFSLFGPERILLISDSLRCCGMPDGPVELSGQTAFSKDGIARLADGSIAGSCVTLFEVLRRVVSFGIPAEDAVRAASRNPAEVLGVFDCVGSIENGKTADFIVTDPEFREKTVYLHGRRLPS